MTDLGKPVFSGSDAQLSNALREAARRTSGSYSAVANAAADLIDTIQTWQPISTAPKDGTVIDVWCVRTHCHGAVDHVRRCDVSWGNMANSFTGEEYEGWRGISEMYAENEPVLWRQRDLPDAPTQDVAS